MRRHAGRSALLLLGILVPAVGLAADGGTGAQGESRGSLLDRPHPDRLEAHRLTALGTDALEQGKDEQALELLGLAVARDPLVVEGWINRAAAAIRTCRPSVARSSAAVARTLAPDSRDAAHNHRVAGRMDCARSDPPSPQARAEAKLFERPDDPAAWAGAARARRQRGDHLLAAFHEEQALRRGAEGARIRLAQDLEAAGLIRAALAALEPARGDRARAMRARLEGIRERLAPTARGLAEEFADRLPPSFRGARESLAALAAVLLVRGSSPQAARETLSGLVDELAGQRIVTEWGRLRPGAAWRRVEPSGDRPWPALVLRRFPSDTQATFHHWPADEWPIEPDRLARRIAAGAAVAKGGWEPCPEPAGSGGLCRAAELEASLGGSRRGTVGLWALGPEEGPPAVAVLTLVGDAGCGKPCRERARAGLHALLGSYRSPEQATTPPGAGEARAHRWPLPVPPLWRPPGPGDEREEPWRSVAIGEGLVLDLPPGVLGRPVSGGFPEPGGSERTVLWLRGAFRDREGNTVRLGNPEWAGWVDLGPAEASVEGWLESVRKRAPTADPAAELVSAARLDEAIDRAGGTGEGAVARFSGDAFDGEWLWVHRRLEGRRVDVHLPVAQGAGSLSLLWIALTVRPREGSPPPPIVDLSDRFDIRFARFEGRRSRGDPREGVLMAAELELALPRGFRITVSGTSRDGFPIKGRHADGSRLEIHRWPPSAGASPKGRKRQALAALGGNLAATEWKPEGRKRGARKWSLKGKTDQRDVCAALLLPAEADAHPAFWLTLRRGEARSTAAWETACELIRDARWKR